MRTLLLGLTSTFLLTASTLWAAEPGSSTLAHYSQVAEVIPLPNVGNLSGITYNHDTGTYFMIQNNSYQILEYDRNFKLLRTLALLNLKDRDTEDIVYLGKGRFALSSEDNSIFVFSIVNNQKEVDLQSSRPDVQFFALPRPQKNNNGLEGVCFAPGGTNHRGTFYGVQEKRPKKVYSFQWPNNEDDFSSWRKLGVIEPFDTDAIMKHRLSDLSGCTFDNSNDHLLVLSHESSRLMELTRGGQIVKMLDIPAVAPQYEGVTFGPDRELILVSEPNVVVIMKRDSSRP